MRGVRVHSGMPDHQVLEAVISAGAFRTLILRFSASTLANRWGAVRISFVPGMHRGSRTEIWQGDHGSTAMAMCRQALLRYMLRTFHHINANVLSREILFERELTLVGSICRNNADEFFLVDDLGQ